MMARRIFCHIYIYLDEESVEIGVRYCGNKKIFARWRTLLIYLKRKNLGEVHFFQRKLEHSNNLPANVELMLFRMCNYA
ncbi:hypothetical protein C7B76_11190 [filamentous cyanobacterium CCP2]|nr:hypothetical protein C7B76_11190 [filamentous cyanobacterium CCP2]